MKNDIGYAVCPVENRGALLVELVSRYWDPRDAAWNKKIVIVFSHDNSVRFYTELFKRLKELPVMPVLKADTVSQAGIEDIALFKESGSGVMAASSTVIEKLLPELRVDTVIQFEPPPSAEFVYKMADICNCYQLFLRPEEVGFVKHLEENREDFVLDERHIPWKKVKNLPAAKLQQYYTDVHSMNLNSKASYKAYMDSIRDHSLPEFFNLTDIKIREVADGYCLPVPPYYKLVKERPKYEIEMERKQAKMSAPAPPTAKKVVNKYVPVVEKTKDKKSGLQKNGVQYEDDGTVKLHRFVGPRSRESKLKRKRLVKKTGAMRALKRQLKKVKGGHKVKYAAPIRRR